MSLAKGLKKVSSKTLLRLGGTVTIKRTLNSSYNDTSGEVIKNESSLNILLYDEGTNQFIVALDTEVFTGKPCDSSTIEPGCMVFGNSVSEYPSMSSSFM